MAGFDPPVEHQANWLDLVVDLILAGMGIGLLPADRTGIALVPLANPALQLHAYVCTRRGQGTWLPLNLVLTQLTRM